jgi:holo-[acyl-carrier protein] synthase
VIEGIGIDIVNIERFSRSVNRWGDRFVKRILTPTEISYCQNKAFPNQSMAVRFAAKEAVFKCLPSQDQPGFHWQDIEVFVDENNGRPQLRFSGRPKALLMNSRAHLSLTHTGSTAIAMVVIEQQMDD